MTDEKRQGADQELHDAAARAFTHHASVAKAPGGRVRSVWARRIEPWLVAFAVLLFVGWALARVFLSR